MEKKNIKNIKKKRKKIKRVLIIILLITLIILFGTLLYLNVLPIIYTILLFMGSLLLLLGIIFSIFSSKKGFRLIGYILSSIILIGSIFIETYLINTLGFLINATEGHYMLKNYNIIVLKDNNYNDITDLNNKTIGLYDIDNVKDVKKEINKKVKLTYQDYNNKDSLINDLENNNIEAIILEASELSLIEEMNKELYQKLKSIYEIEVKLDISEVKDAININKEPFNIYISGIDTYGNISQVSRSDVNILVSVNPKSEKILITWIPRDYFVDINKGINDKLTHAGMYGINTSIGAIEKLLDVNINYYVKVNFTSVIKVVDLLKGIKVYNDETFTTNENITFKEGYITLNGEEALSFVRDRKHVTGGDIGRGKNQIKVLEALINKALSKDIIKNYNKLLNTLDGTFVTNMDRITITSFVKKELLKRRNWKIKSVVLTGSDGREYTYSVPTQDLYVMMPDEDMVNNTKIEIKEVLAS